MSTGVVAEVRVGDDQPAVRASPGRPPRRGSARARRSPRSARGRRRGSRARSAPAPRCTRSRSGAIPGSSRRDRAQLEGPARTAAVDQLRQRIGQPARADVVDRQDRVRRAQLPAAIDHLLHRRWISALPRWTESKSRSAVLVPVAIDDAAPPPIPISMPGPPSWISSAPSAIGCLVHVRGRDVAHAAGDHDRLVVAADLACHASARSCGSSRAGSAARTRC